MLLKELNAMLMGLEVPNEMKMFLVERMSEIEYRLSLSCSESIQVLSLIGGFQEARVARKE